MWLVQPLVECCYYGQDLTISNWSNCRSPLTLISPSSGIVDAQGMPLDSGGVIGWGMRPGDANGDRQFDQFDIVNVLQAGKYLTGEPANWAQGDWTGDGIFDQQDVAAALQTGAFLQGPFASRQQGHDGD